MARASAATTEPATEGELGHFNDWFASVAAPEISESQQAFLENQSKNEKSVIEKIYNEQINGQFINKLLHLLYNA